MPASIEANQEAQEKLESYTPFFLHLDTLTSSWLDTHRFSEWAINSVVECHLHTVEVTGSSPVSPTIYGASASDGGGLVDQAHASATWELKASKLTSLYSMRPE